MAIFRKKPELVEAIRFGATSYKNILKFFGDIRPRRFTDGDLAIETDVGMMRVCPGDWIVKKAMGKFRRYRHDEFVANYEVNE